MENTLATFVITNFREQIIMADHDSEQELFNGKKEQFIKPCSLLRHAVSLAK